MSSSGANRERLVSPMRHGRHFFITKEGYLGLVPASAQVNDLIVVFPGGRVPFCVRQIQENPAAYHIIGDWQVFHLIGLDCLTFRSYVDGLMKGEIMDMVSIGKSEKGCLPKEETMSTKTGRREIEEFEIH
jgi:hypothetical protein